MEDYSVYTQVPLSWNWIQKVFSLEHVFIHELTMLEDVESVFYFMMFFYISLKFISVDSILMLELTIRNNYIMVDVWYSSLH